MAPSAYHPAVLIAGIGEGFGLALAKAFAGAGYDVIGLSRSGRCDPAAAAETVPHGRSYLPLICDVTDETAIARLLAPHAARIEVAIYNAHHLVIAPFLDTGASDFAKAMAINCGGAVAMARALLPAMLARGKGTLILTGATAARRASAGFAALAMSKFALRALAQSLAREYGPKGIHVTHMVVDGLIDEPQTHRRFADRTSAMIDADALAATYLSIMRQPPSTWTHEIDVRPSSGKF